MKTYDAVIIGGGIAGLTAAYRLSKSGKRVLVLEKESQLGGATRSIKRGSYYIEEYYHHVFTDNYCFFNLIKELGLYEKLKRVEARTGFMYDKLYELSKPLDLLKFKPLNFIDKINFVRLMLKIRFIKDLEKYDKINAKKWFIKNSSRSVYNKLFKKLIREKWSEYAEDVSAAFLIKRLQLRGDRGKKGERLCYMEGGFHTVFEELARRIKKNRGVIKTNVKIKKMYLEDKKITKIQYDNTTAEANFVINTTVPTDLVGYIDFPELYLEKIKKLKKQWMVIVLVGLKKKISPFYWTNIMRPGIRFGAIIEHTNLMPSSQYNDENILYLTSYPNSSSDIFKLKEEKVFRLYFKDLMELFPKIKKSDVLWYRVFRSKYATIVYETGLLEYMPGCETPIKNLFMAGMFNTYPERGIELSIKKAYECINLLK